MLLATQLLRPLSPALSVVKLRETDNACSLTASSKMSLGTWCERLLLKRLPMKTAQLGGMCGLSARLLEWISGLGRTFLGFAAVKKLLEPNPYPCCGLSCGLDLVRLQLVDYNTLTCMRTVNIPGRLTVCVLLSASLKLRMIFQPCIDTVIIFQRAGGILSPNCIHCAASHSSCSPWSNSVFAKIVKCSVIFDHFNILCHYISVRFLTKRSLPLQTQVNSLRGLIWATSVRAAIRSLGSRSCLQSSWLPMKAADA